MFLQSKEAFLKTVEGHLRDNRRVILLEAAQNPANVGKKGLEIRELSKLSGKVHKTKLQKEDEHINER